MDCSCAPIFRFFSLASDGATTMRQIQNRVLGSISYQFEEGQRRQLCIDLDAVFAVCQSTRCTLQCTKHFAVPSQVAPQEQLICDGNIPTRRNSAAQLCEILRILTIYIVINSTHVQQHMRMKIPCRYALSSRGRCFCFQFLFVLLLSSGSPCVRGVDSSDKLCAAVYCSRVSSFLGSTPQR